MKIDNEILEGIRAEICEGSNFNSRLLNHIDYAEEKYPEFCDFIKGFAHSMSNLILEDISKTGTVSSEIIAGLAVTCGILPIYCIAKQEDVREFEEIFGE